MTRHRTPSTGRPTGRLSAPSTFRALAVLGLAFLVGGCGSASLAAAPATPSRSAPAGTTAALPTPTGPTTRGGSGPAGPTQSPGLPSPGTTASPAPSASPSPSPTATPIPAQWPLVATGKGGPAATFVLHVPVLMYHRVAPASQIGDSLPGLVVDPALFRRQMDALAAAGWHTITAAQLAADLQAGHAPPLRTFVVTLDDGREDGYTYAFPILRAHHFVATYFVPTGRIGHPDNLSPAELTTMAAAGMEIASHTVTHARLPKYPVQIIEWQLTSSSATIAVDLGRRAVTFAYPYGGRDPLVESLVSRAGYAAAFTEGPGCTETWASRMFLPRMRVSPSSDPASLLGRMSACGG